MSDLEPWERLAQLGDFRLVPSKLTWKRSGRLAHFLDGYVIAGGQERLLEAMQAKRAEYAATGTYTGTAFELWIALFAEWRDDRWSGGYPRTQADTKRLTALASALANELRKVPPEESAPITDLFSMAYDPEDELLLRALKAAAARLKQKDLFETS